MLFNVCFRHASVSPWERCRQTPVASGDELEGIARAHVSFKLLRATEERIEIGHAGVARITLNGIAQGYITEAVHRQLRREGIAHALVNCGEYRAIGGRGVDRAWRLGIQHPREGDAYLGVIESDGRAVATSGDYNTQLPDGRNHCFDPRTGQAVSHWRSLTVLAADATTADAYSTALFVMSPAEAGEFCAGHPNLGVLAVDADGRVMRTDAFPAFVA